MKEIENPWQNWEGDTGIVPQPARNPDGVAIVLGIAAQLGIANIFSASGMPMEGQAELGNFMLWNPTRIKTLRARLGTDPAATAELLKPLFCTQEINLHSSHINHQGSVEEVLGDFLVDPSFVTDGITLSPQEYTRVISSPEVNQRVARTVDRATGRADDSSLLMLNGRVLRETSFSFNYPERSEADADYAKKLNQQKIVDPAFVAAVLVTDFVRPIFSGGSGELRVSGEGLAPMLSAGRCELRQFAPAVADDENLAANIKAGFIANLQAKTSRSPIEEAFLQNLLRSDLGMGTPPEVDAFFSACSARATADPHGFVRDLLRVGSINRRIARRLQIVEHMELMPADDLQDDLDTRLDPATCAIPN
jgi:hypothetical protein